MRGHPLHEVHPDAVLVDGAVRQRVQIDLRPQILAGAQKPHDARDAGGGDIVTVIVRRVLLSA